MMNTEMMNTAKLRKMKPFKSNQMKPTNSPRKVNSLALAYKLKPVNSNPKTSQTRKLKLKLPKKK
jgi:hypothetical protein